MESESSKIKSDKPLPVLLIVLVSLLLIGIGLPFYREINLRIQNRRYVNSRTKNNMKQMGLAFHNYHETYLTLPAGALLDDSRLPAHSWTSLTLPYVDQEFLSKQIDFSQGWDAPDNRAVFRQTVPCYLNFKLNKTTSPEGYALSHFAGNELVLKSGASLTFNDMHDGTSNTIMAMEIGENFKPWGDPTSLTEPIKVIGPDKKAPSEGGSLILMGDGTVRFINKNIDPAILKALSTPAGGEEVGEF